jgi:hypothetical protein
MAVMPMMHATARAGEIVCIEAAISGGGLRRKGDFTAA